MKQVQSRTDPKHALRNPVPRENKQRRVGYKQLQLQQIVNIRQLQDTNHKALITNLLKSDRITTNKVLFNIQGT